MGGSASRLVWHIHGAVNLNDARSRYVLTDGDYDDAYLEDSDLLRQIRGLLSYRRLVIVGFGLRDPRFMIVLRRIGRLANPAFPILAFVSEEDVGDDHKRESLLEECNIDVVPYRPQDKKHSGLYELLKAYGSFVLTRSLKFGKERRICPSFHPETTSLLLYNELALKRPVEVLNDEIIDALVEARILAFIHLHGGASTQEMTEQLLPHFSSAETTEAPGRQVRSIIERAITSLAHQGYLVDTDGWALTEVGIDEVGRNAGSARLLENQFSASLKARADALSRSEGDAGLVAETSESFLKHCVEERALGIAMAWASADEPTRRYHIVALMQALPSFMEELPTAELAQDLTHLVEGVLAAPTEPELTFLGAALQARFGVHILGYDPVGLSSRLKELSSTGFLVDSSTLIPYLARNSWGHDAAKRLIKSMARLSGGVGTTGLLSEEVAEHARWAISKAEDNGTLGSAALAAATGRGGQRHNAFLDGLLEEVDEGSSPPNLFHYLSEVFNIAQGTIPNYEHVMSRLREDDLVCSRFGDWEGLEDPTWFEVEELKKRIAARRKELETYTHDRQAKAEAEALVIVRHLRAGSMTLNGKKCTSAYFVSYTRILDELDTPGLPVTVRPEPLFHWLAALSPMPAEDLGVFTSNLLGELFQRGLSVVDDDRIRRTFTPLISAAKEDIEDQYKQHRTLTAQILGEDSGKAFSSLDEIDLPLAARALNRQRADHLEVELKQERAARAAAQKEAQLTDKQKRSLEDHRRKQDAKAAKSKKKKRAAASKPRRRRRRRT